MALGLTLLEVLLGPWLLLTMGGVAALTVYWLIKGRWTRAAARLGMKYVWQDVTPSLIDERDGFQIRIGGSIMSRDARRPYEVQIDGRGRIPADLWLSAKPGLIRVMGPFTDTGDAFFDDQVRVAGSEVVALALLDRTARDMVFDAVARRGVEVAEGKVFLGLQKLAPEKAATAIERGLRLARRLQSPQDGLVAALARNAIRDPSPEVRLRNLELMQEHYSDDEITRSTCRQLAGAEPSQLSLEAGIFLGEEGVETVCGIARNQELPEDVRVRAVEHLAQVQDNEQVTILLERLLDEDSEPLRLAAIRSLGRLGYRPVLARLEAMTATADPQTAVALIEALAMVGGPDSERCLIRQLAARDTQVRVAAIRALAEIGTPQAVEPLQELTGSIVPVLRRTSHLAIAAIQGRLIGADRGQVSLAALDDETGQLSIAAPEGGLSPAQDG
jgi:HEAT repeat protein